MRASATRLGLAIGAAVLLAAPTASAFCRTTTVPVPPSFVPAGKECWNEGLPLYHPSQCVPYRLRTADSPVIPNVSLGRALGAAFAAWTAPNAICTPGIDVLELAAADVAIGYEKNAANANTIAVLPNAPDGDGPTLALTILTFLADTGAVLDVDMELYADHPWSVDGTPGSDEYDLDGAMTHEAGHFLGFAHTTDPATIMFPTYALGSTTGRVPTSDEREAICTVYPNLRERRTGSTIVASTACELTAGSPTTSATCSPDISHGCASSPGRTEQGTLAALVVAAAGIVLVRRRRR